MNRLYEIQTEIQTRVSSIESANPTWPCRKGCSDCCRQLASEPRISEAEWHQVASAIDALPRETARTIRHRIRESAGRSRPVTCPMLDLDTGACLIYEARPLACRAYGFYADRDKVLGCHRIESISSETPDIIWGNHRTLEANSRDLRDSKELSAWLESRIK